MLCKDSLDMVFAAVVVVVVSEHRRHYGSDVASSKQLRLVVLQEFQLVDGLKQPCGSCCRCVCVGMYELQETCGDLV